MAYFFTKVPTDWSPNTVYQLSNEIILKPAGRVRYDDLLGTGSAIFFDTIYFVTTSQTVEEHILKLRNWILFHAFIFNFHYACVFFESGLLMDHRQANSIEEIQEELEANTQARDYDNTADEIYFFYKPGVLLNYRSLFEQYQNLPEDDNRLLKSYLFQMNFGKSVLLTYSLFDDTRKYWQITHYIALIEAVVGHAPNCQGGDEIICPVCQKKFIHRKGSEEKWRKEYLENLGINNPILGTYLDIINTAYRKVRSATAHANKIGNPTYPVISGTEVYTSARTVHSFKDDMHALDNLMLSTCSIARYLLLNYLFQLSIFPPLEDFKVTHIEL